MGNHKSLVIFSSLASVLQKYKKKLVRFPMYALPPFLCSSVNSYGSVITCLAYFVLILMNENYGMRGVV